METNNKINLARSTPPEWIEILKSVRGDAKRTETKFWVLRLNLEMRVYSKSTLLIWFRCQILPRGQ